MHSHFSIPRNHPCLEGHFPGNPIVPGVLVLEHVLKRLCLGNDAYPLKIRKVKLMGMLLPGEVAYVNYHEKFGEIVFRVTVERRKLHCDIATGAIVSKLEHKSK